VVRAGGSLLAGQRGGLVAAPPVVLVPGMWGVLDVAPLRSDTEW